MASALRFAARRICGRAFQRSAQPYFTAVVKEEERRLFPSISHAGSSVRRFSSSKSPNLLNNNKHAPNSAAGAAEAEPTPPIWSPKNKMFLPFAWGYTMALCAACYAIVYVENRLMGGPFEWKEQPDNTGTEPYAFGDSTIIGVANHGANSAAGAAETGPTSPPPLSSPRNKMFLPFVWGCSMALCAACYAIVYVEDRIMGPFGSKDPMLQKKHDYCSCVVCNTAFQSKEQLDNTGTEPYAP